MPFYFRTILVIANDVKYFNNLSIMPLDVMSFGFLLSIADWTTRLGATRIVGFCNFAKHTNCTSKEYSDSSYFIFAGYVSNLKWNGFSNISE